jgi:metal-responsive CopG/Arc/MetJ family transcriptional regulator
MKKLKTAISMDAELFQQADRLAKREGISRSELYSRAIRQLVEQERNRELLRRLDSAHATKLGPSEKNWLQLAKKRQAGLVKDEW